MCGDQGLNFKNEGIGGEEQANKLPLEGREQLLRTKLFIPPIRSNRVPRPRLMEQINGGLEKALILVSAPAGYGKTTLVSSWLRETDIPSAWLSLDEGDNDPIHFLQYFITALHQIVPAIQLDLLGVLQGMQPAPYEALVNIIINEIAEQAAPLVLVLDDFHTIQAQPVLDISAYLIEHIPPQLHLALLTRTDPPLPLSRLRVRNQLVDVRAEQLRFTLEEIAYFLNDSMHLDLSKEDIEAMEVRTEGWIASLQLAACSMQGGEDAHRFVSAFTGSNYYVMDYLVEEVLKRRLGYLYPHQPCELHQRASQWYEQNRFVPEAIQHSLAAGDQEPRNSINRTKWSSSPDTRRSDHSPQMDRIRRATLADASMVIHL